MLAEVRPTTGDSNLPADVEVANAIAAGDHDVFRTLIQRYNRRLYRISRSILRDDSEAEDALQNAYVLAYREISKFRGEATLSTWLTRIVINEALSYRRKQGRAQVIGLEGADLDTAVDAAAGAMGKAPERPEQTFFRADVGRRIQAKIDELPVIFRTVFMLRAVEELSVTEAAVALDIPEATVRTRFFRARALLRDALSGEVDMTLDTAFPFAGARCAGIVARVMDIIAEDAVVMPCGQNAV